MLLVGSKLRADPAVRGPAGTLKRGVIVAPADCIAQPPLPLLHSLWR